MVAIPPDSAMPDDREREINFGSLGKLDSAGRLLIPADIRQAISWLKGKNPVRLLAELRENGRVRFHPLQSIRGALLELRTRIGKSHPHPTEAFAVLSDRYREVTYYPSDTRVHLPQTVSIYLGSGGNSADLYYIEARDTHFDAMTLAVRNDRIELFLNDLDLPPSGEA